MNKYSCVIIEDEPLALEKTRDFVLKVPFLHLAATFDNALTGLAYLNNNKVDVLFLDINMDELTGIELLESSRINSQVIITTAYQEYALKGYELQITDYLLKPFDFERFLSAVTRVRKGETEKQAIPENKEVKDHLFINIQKKKVKILFSDIIYIESQREYIKIVTTKKEYISKMSTHEIESLLPPTLFRRVHRSFIISIKKIDSYTSDLVEVSGITIPIGRGYRESMEGI